MDAKNQSGCQKSKWLPKIKMATKNQNGCQIKMADKNQNGLQKFKWPPINQNAQKQKVVKVQISHGKVIVKSW